MPISTLDRDADAGLVASMLRRDGAVIVKDLVGADIVGAVRAELRPELDAKGLETESDFNGSLTNRISNVLTVAPSAAAIVDHDMVVAVANEILLPHCASYHIGSMTAIEIMPGEAAQALHRDDTPFPIDHAGMEIQIGVMWALNDFTEENGGTRVVPGSHRFSSRLASPEPGELGIDDDAARLSAVLSRVDVARRRCKPDQSSPHGTDQRLFSWLAAPRIKPVSPSSP